MDTVGERKSGPMEKVASMDTQTLSGDHGTAGEPVRCSAGGPAGCSARTWRDGMGGGEGGAVCIIMADLCCCISETNTTW